MRPSRPGLSKNSKKGTTSGRAGEEGPPRTPRKEAEGVLTTSSSSQALYDEAKKRGWVVVSIKDDWKRLFPFDQ